MFVFREVHEKRDYASDLIKSLYFENKHIDQIFEIFIYYDPKVEKAEEGKKVFRKKHYRKYKPLFQGDPPKRTTEKKVEFISLK